jgi:transcriptional regulator GlxA family with amidase domain
VAATYTVEWLQPGILLLRRTGLMSVDEASEYAATAARMATTAPARWGAVVDVRGAVAQTDEVQQIIQRIIQAFVSKNVARIAMVSSSAITEMQQRRVATGPGMHDPKTLALYRDFDQAVADVKTAIAS